MEIHGYSRAGARDQRSIGIGNEIKLSDRGPVTEKDDRISAHGATLAWDGSTRRQTELVAFDTTTVVASINISTGLITDSVLFFAFVNVDTGSILASDVSVAVLAIADLRVFDETIVAGTAKGALYTEFCLITTLLSVFGTVLVLGRAELFHRDTACWLLCTLVVGIGVAGFSFHRSTILLITSIQTVSVVVTDKAVRNTESIAASELSISTGSRSGTVLLITTVRTVFLSITLPQSIDTCRSSLTGKFQWASALSVSGSTVALV